MTCANPVGLVPGTIRGTVLVLVPGTVAGDDVEKGPVPPKLALLAGPGDQYTHGAAHGPRDEPGDDGAG